MPEGPEIRLAADKIAKVLEGETCKSIEFGLDRLKGQAHHFASRYIVEVKPRGKAMLIYFDNGKVIYSHNQLYGKWITLKPNETYASNRQLRIQITTDKGQARLYSASDIDLLDKETVNQHSFIRKLGPDILDRDVSDSEFEVRFLDDQFAQRSLGSLLLDQGFVAGTGNYLRSEVLFAEGLHPQFKLGALTPSQRRSLARTTRRITQRSYASKGLCLSEEQTCYLKSQNDDYEYYRFAVFGHENRACVTCGHPIEKQKIAGRRLYWCPRCQPEK